MKRYFATLCIALALGAQTTFAAAADLPTPSSVFSAGTLHVEKYGGGQPTLILVAGLSSGSWSWTNVIRAFASKDTIYAVTLPGFDGTPATDGPLLDKADAGLVALIAQEHLVKPILIGHSLGGFLTIRFAERHPDVLRSAVAVDGLPVFPTMSQTPPDQRKAMAAQIAAQLKGSTPAQYLAGQQATLSTMINDPKKAADAALLSAKSQPAAVGDFAAELLASDIRPELGNITVPLLEIAPIVGDPKTLPAGYPDMMRNMTVQQLSDSTVGFYQSLFPGAKTVQVLPIQNSRHFVMIDQPDALNAALAQFIDKTSR